MADPLFWLALSFLLVVVSLTTMLMVAIPVLKELGRAARSAEKMFDTLSRELPPTLEAIRLTGLEITELTDDVTDGVQSAGQVVQQVNQSISSAQTGVKRLNKGTKSLWAGARAAWQTLSTAETSRAPQSAKSFTPPETDRNRPPSQRPTAATALEPQERANHPDRNGDFGGARRPFLASNDRHSAADFDGEVPASPPPVKSGAEVQQADAEPEQPQCQPPSTASRQSELDRS
ncbi:DUF948 domain-containing protein [Nodosilinea sp. LEGE 07088]|uniref:DUF948 domain-containing protein n=1 Tax=Nodosilinea sp. LEGE 07088 TaxID=2777968 RepID=UPI00187E231B|nr:DUF948 domain-containing protein [Nodosilinea sp. LEGE 07088]MBE9140837.1 DUF948 domain-containing protein [Nodosilinea sp. LEGE 07088]